MRKSRKEGEIWMKEILLSYLFHILLLFVVETMYSSVARNGI